MTYRKPLLKGQFLHAGGAAQVPGGAEPRHQMSLRALLIGPSVRRQGLRRDHMLPSVTQDSTHALAAFLRDPSAAPRVSLMCDGTVAEVSSTAGFAHLWQGGI